VLDGGDLRADLPPGTRAVGLAALAVLTAGVLVAVDSRVPEEPVPPAGRASPAPPFEGVVAQAVPGRSASEPYVERFALEVRAAGASAPPGDGGSAAQERVRLLGLAGRGFGLTLTGGSLPVDLTVGPQGTTSVFRVEVRVVDCAVETQAQRRLDLRLARGGRPEGTVQIATGPELVQALDRLVARTCRRPRG
jgi:hypothetical protein